MVSVVFSCPQAAILYSLEHYCYEDAVFLAERLYDEGKRLKCLHRASRALKVAKVWGRLSHGVKTVSLRMHEVLCVHKSIILCSNLLVY